MLGLPFGHQGLFFSHQGLLFGQFLVTKVFPLLIKVFPNCLHVYWKHLVKTLWFVCCLYVSGGGSEPVLALLSLLVFALQF